MQDDLTQVPAGSAAGALALSTSPENGTASITSDGHITYTPDQDFVGTDSFTYSLTDNDGATSTAAVTVTVTDPTVVAGITVTSAATEVDRGGSITFTVEGSNAVGASLGDVTGDVVFTSNVVTDVVVGNQVTFPTASPHTITATHQPTGVTAEVVVQVVEPDARPTLAATGASDSVPGLLVTGCLLALAGASVLVLVRRRRA